MFTEAMHVYACVCVCMNEEGYPQAISFNPFDSLGAR
jgi:hypothetical protein